MLDEIGFRAEAAVFRHINISLNRDKLQTCFCNKAGRNRKVTMHEFRTCFNWLRECLIMQSMDTPSDSGKSFEDCYFFPGFSKRTSCNESGSAGADNDDVE